MKAKIKKRIIFIGIALWLIAFMQMLQDGFSHKNDENPIITAFADNNFLSTVSTITATGSYKNIYLSGDERESLLLEIAHNLGISSKLVYDSVTEDDVTTSSLVRTGDNASTVLKLITTEKKISSNEISLKNVITAEIEIDNSLDSAFYYKDILKKALEDAGISSDVTIRLDGNIQGELSMSEKNIIADHLIDSADGDILTESRRNDMFTIYAYTDMIDDYILSGSMKTNLNLVITYNELEDMTYVSMATPFLNDDF